MWSVVRFDLCFRKFFIVGGRVSFEVRESEFMGLWWGEWFEWKLVIVVIIFL